MKRIIAGLAIVLAASVAYAQSFGPFSPVGVSASAAYTSSATATSTFPWGPSFVVVFCTTTCFVKVGESASATSADFPLPANVATVLRVPPGTGAPWRVSAIQQSSGGSVFAQPVN